MEAEQQVTDGGWVWIIERESKLRGMLCNKYRNLFYMARRLHLYSDIQDFLDDAILFGVTVASKGLARNYAESTIFINIGVYWKRDLLSKINSQKRRATYSELHENVSKDSSEIHFDFDMLLNKLSLRERTLLIGWSQSDMSIREYAKTVNVSHQYLYHILEKARRVVDRDAVFS